LSALHTLARYKAWADELLYGAIAKAPSDLLTAPQPIVFGSLLRTLNHVHAMDIVWRAHLEGRPHGLKTRNPESPPFESLRDAQKEMDAWYIDYARHLSGPAAEEVVHFTFIGGGAGAMSRGDILLHVVNHATYHRGHVADMLYRTGLNPPTTDLPVFLRA
jgi:uncharacterized damage-inducible protein DinB